MIHPLKLPCGYLFLTITFAGLLAQAAIAQELDLRAKRKAFPVTLPEGWDAANVKIEGVTGFVNGDEVVVPTTFFIFQSAKLRTTAPYGRYCITFEHKKDKEDLNVTVSDRNIRAANLIDVAEDTAYPSAAGTHSSPVVAPINFSGNAVSLPGLYAKLSIPQSGQGKIEQLVVDKARSWGATRTGRNDWVSKLDGTPESTCKAISQVFEKTANALPAASRTMSRPEIVRKIEKLMRDNFQEFYKGIPNGASKVSARRDEWMPFLLSLEGDLHKQIPADQSANTDYLRMVLLELTNGFDGLAQEIRESAPRTDTRVSQSGAVHPGPAPLVLVLQVHPQYPCTAVTRPRGRRAHR